jgi:hypothetical protein
MKAHSFTLNIQQRCTVSFCIFNEGTQRNLKQFFLQHFVLSFYGILPKKTQYVLVELDQLEINA